MSNAKGAPIAISDRKRLLAVVKRDGERQTARAVGFDRLTLCRALAGLAVYAGTASLISKRLPRLEKAGR